MVIAQENIEKHFGSDAKDIVEKFQKFARKNNAFRDLYLQGDSLFLDEDNSQDILQDELNSQEDIFLDNSENELDMYDK